MRLQCFKRYRDDGVTRPDIQPAILRTNVNPVAITPAGGQMTARTSVTFAVAPPARRRPGVGGLPRRRNPEGLTVYECRMVAFDVCIPRTSK